MITGASAGIGQETARQFSAAGHPVLLLARRLDRLQAMELPDSVCVSTDVSDREAVLDAVSQGEAVHGPVDCLINNAGVAPLAKIEEQDPCEWKEMFDVNMTGVLNCMQAVMPQMQKRRHGTIINVSSIAGRKSYPFHDVYCGTKHFVHAVSEGARRNMSAHNVRVITISPGITKTDIEKTMTNANGHEFWAAGRDSMDGGIEPSTVAKTMLFAYQMPQDVILQELTITPTCQEY